MAAVFPDTPSVNLETLSRANACLDVFASLIRLR